MGKRATVIGLVACAATHILGLSIAMAPVPAKAQDYGLYPGDSTRAWTRINKDGVTGWRRKVEEVLTGRGFTAEQIRKFVRLDVDIRSADSRKGIIEFSDLSLPVKFSTETGQKLPLDPVAYARALPDCYREDERFCTLRYSAQHSAFEDLTHACILPKRTLTFCRATGFVNMYTWNRETSAGRKQQASYAPSCGEQPRGNGCGADLVVFDDASAQTKLAFNVSSSLAAARKNAEAQPAAPGNVEGPAATFTPATASNIVYHAKKDSSFLRREGPAEREEWEVDVKRYVSIDNAAARAQGRRQNELLRQRRALFGEALRYCWPHDVFQPCDAP